MTKCKCTVANIKTLAQNPQDSALKIIDTETLNNQNYGNREISGDLYEDGSILFCKVCQHSIDHIWRQIIVEHLRPLRHKNRKASGIPQISSLNNRRKCEKKLLILFELGNEETAVCCLS